MAICKITQDYCSAVMILTLLYVFKTAVGATPWECIAKLLEKIHLSLSGVPVTPLPPHAAQSVGTSLCIPAVSWDAVSAFLMLHKVLLLTCMPTPYGPGVVLSLSLKAVGPAPSHYHQFKLTSTAVRMLL